MSADCDDGARGQQQRGTIVGALVTLEEYAGTGLGPTAVRGCLTDMQEGHVPREIAPSRWMPSKEMKR